jgi:hypothetical protein
MKEAKGMSLFLWCLYILYSIIRIVKIRITALEAEEVVTILGEDKKGF